MKQATSCNQMVEAIQQHVHDEFRVQEHDDLCMIVTPMLYPDNSRICIYFEATDSRHFMLTDHGEASDYAFVNGVPRHVVHDQAVDTIHRFKLLDIGGDELALQMERSEVTQGIFTLTQAIQDISYLVYRRSPVSTP